MHRHKLQLGLFAVVAALALPAVATAGDVVPPGNSAVNQYTETFPTSKGQKATKQGGKDRSPRKVLGADKAERLQSAGEAGRDLAKVVAATAPSAPPATDARAETQPAQGQGSRADVDESTAFTEVVRQAGGSSDSGGGMGIALPLLILAAAFGFAFYAWRRRRVVA
jgi:hypothetical protein